MAKGKKAFYAVLKNTLGDLYPKDTCILLLL